MAKSHEFDCTVCGKHFDDDRGLQTHNREQHSTKQAADTDSAAEPMGKEKARGGATATSVANPSRPTSASSTPRYGSAGGGGAEFEPGPIKD